MGHEVTLFDLGQNCRLTAVRPPKAAVKVAPSPPKTGANHLVHYTNMSWSLFWRWDSNNAGSCQPDRRVPMPFRSFVVGRASKNLNRDGSNVGAAPGRRDADGLRHELHSLREQVADDCDDAPRAIEYGRARSAVIQSEAVVSIVHLEQRRAGKHLAIAILHKSTARDPLPI